MSTQTTPDPPRETKQLTGDRTARSDEWHIQNDLAIPHFKPERFSEYPDVVPDALLHTWDAGREQSSGGTDFLAIGPPGCGKSTLLLNAAKIVMGQNGDTAVWRGSTSRSEWLPFGPYARVLLPAQATVTARWQPKDPTQSARKTSLERLESEGWIREIVRYDDPVDLWSNKILREGFNVVYPDPEMVGCQTVFEASERTYNLEFAPGDPPGHWWIAAALARVEGQTPNYWTSLFIDEIGDIAPEHAENDEYKTYNKVQLLRDAYADFRKMGVSAYMAGHVEADVHHLLRHKIRWRVTMNGTANPTSSGSVVGFENVPMNFDVTSGMPVGEALMWTERHFDVFGWADVPDPAGGQILSLQVAGAGVDA
jgi:energy-coupling factor transporter ATP-binding protein EcfA2